MDVKDKVRAAMKEHCKALQSAEDAKRALDEAEMEVGATRKRTISVIKASGKPEVIYEGGRWCVTEEGELEQADFDGLVL